MKRLALSSLVLTSLCFMVGCGSVQVHRARQLSRWAQHWSAETHARLESAVIAKGDSPAQVYVALGTPSWEVPHPDAKASRNELWAYLGTMVEETSETVQFLSRNELRLPRVREDPKVLQLTFRDGSLVAWHVDALAQEDLGREPSGPLGTIPDLVRRHPPPTD